MDSKIGVRESLFKIGEGDGMTTEPNGIIPYMRYAFAVMRPHNREFTDKEVRTIKSRVLKALNKMSKKQIIKLVKNILHTNLTEEAVRISDLK